MAHGHGADAARTRRVPITTIAPPCPATVDSGAALAQLEVVKTVGGRIAASEQLGPAVSDRIEASVEVRREKKRKKRKKKNGSPIS